MADLETKCDDSNLTRAALWGCMPADSWSAAPSSWLQCRLADLRNRFGEACCKLTRLELLEESPCATHVSTILKHSFASSIRLRLAMAGVLNRTAVMQAAAGHEMLLRSGMPSQHGNQHGPHGIAGSQTRDSNLHGKACRPTCSSCSKSPPNPWLQHDRISGYAIMTSR